VTGAPLALGILVPCRNESAVIGRKLANLARAVWPGNEATPHRVVVVDDYSDDGTRERAREACARLFADLPGVVASVVANDVRPGKPGAVRQGIAALEGVDLIVLTDADVVLAEDALYELEHAFRADSRLAMACGAQSHVASVPLDGTRPRGSSAESTDTTYDRLTAHVRGLESRFGSLFSVHGQLLAWRAALDLQPSFGIAADDLDLMLQVRERKGAQGTPSDVRLVPEATFYEAKPAAGPVADEQALRRARAYVQVMRAERQFAGGIASRLQCLAYRELPLAAPWLVPVAIAVPLLTLACFALGPAGSLGALVALGFLLPPGRRLRKLLGIIRRAVRIERETPLAERWEMARR
jgi:hypothetical protein